MTKLHYNELTSLHLELSSRCQAKCPMCHRHLYSDYVVPNDISLNDFKQWVPAELISRLNMILLCGTVGDSITAKDSLKIFEYIRSINKDMFILLLTHGSARSPEYWERLAKANVTVKFAIDGLEDTHSLYRIGTNWNTIINNAKIFINNGGSARWQMLLFKHNEHQVKECEALSKKLGFKEFITRSSPRFKNGNFMVHSDNGDYLLEPTTGSKILSNTRSALTNIQNASIHCEALVEKRIYISADGLVSPCSWIDCLKILRQELRDQHRELFKNIPSLHTHSLKNIVESDGFQSIFTRINTDPLTACKWHCIDAKEKRSVMISNRHKS